MGDGGAGRTDRRQSAGGSVPSEPMPAPSPTAPRLWDTVAVGILTPRIPPMGNSCLHHPSVQHPAASLNVGVGQGRHAPSPSADSVTGTAASICAFGGSPPRTGASGDRGRGWLHAIGSHDSAGSLVGLPRGSARGTEGGAGLAWLRGRSACPWTSSVFRDWTHSLIG